VAGTIIVGVDEFRSNRAGGESGRSALITVIGGTGTLAPARGGAYGIAA